MIRQFDNRVERVKDVFTQFRESSIIFEIHETLLFGTCLLVTIDENREMRFFRQEIIDFLKDPEVETRRKIPIIEMVVNHKKMTDIVKCQFLRSLKRELSDENDPEFRLFIELQSINLGVSL